MRVAAIDQGTTSTRAFVLDETGTGRVVAVKEHRQYYPRPGWVEHDAEELLSHVTSCLESVGAVDAIGIDNQGESCLAWDSETGKALSPVIVWQDNRTHAVTEGLKAQGAEALTLARAGLPLDPYFSASKLAWIVQNIPEARALRDQGRLRLGTTDAFFLDRLTGVFATDITTASRTSLLDLERGIWDPELCDLFAVPIDALPEIRPTMGDFWSITLKGREVPLTVNIVDQQASLFGHGCRSAGDAKITFGTGAFALALTGDILIRAPDQALLPTVAWQETAQPPIFAIDGGIYCAGSAINWAKSLGLFSRFDDINGFDQPPAVERGLVFVPALTGLACPYWERSAAGLWIGLSLDTTAPIMVQAILEGIAFRAGQVIEAMHAHVPIGDQISIDGGMSANPYFCQFLANVLGRDVVVQETGELTALGTALLTAGNKEKPERNDEAVQLYRPKCTSEHWAERFTEAVERARKWRP